MNVLRFPIQLRTGKNQFMRAERLKEREEKESMLDENANSLENQTTALGKSLLLPLAINRIEELAVLEKIEPTVKWRRRFESEMNLPKSGVSYTFSSGENAFQEDRSFESSEHNYINYRQKKMRAFNPDSYKREKWLYDTPGVILSEQVRSKI